MPNLADNVSGQSLASTIAAKLRHCAFDGLQTAAVDRNGNATAYAYDASDRPVSVTDPAGLVTTLGYAGGKLSSVTDPAGRVTGFAHDADGNLVRITDPDGSVRDFAYDGRHRLISQTAKRGFVTSYAYGFHGRVVQADWPDGTTRLTTPAGQAVSMAYDPAGRCHP